MKPTGKLAEGQEAAGSRAQRNRNYMATSAKMGPRVMAGKEEEKRKPDACRDGASHLFRSPPENSNCNKAIALGPQALMHVGRHTSIRAASLNVGRG